MNKPVKLQEKTRIYTFPGGDTLTLQDITEIIVSNSGTHRIKANGKLHIIPKTWIHIEIDESDWTV